MKAVLALLFIALFVAIVSAQTRFSLERTDTEEMFREWQDYHVKSYANAEEAELRYYNFLGAIEHAKDLNSKFNSTTYGITMFADMSIPEWRAKYLMDRSKLAKSTATPTPNFVKNPPSYPMPSVGGQSAALGVGGLAPNTHYDWAFETCVTPVYDQGGCGSCWAFSAMEQIESDHALQHKLKASDLTSQGTYPLAVQQIVDCDTGSYGCNGGWTEDAYNYVMGAGGLMTNKQYPYTAQNGNCQDNGGQKAVSISGWNYVGNGNDAGLLNALRNGPVSVCIAADIFYSYSSGVITAAACGDNVDHCIQLTGIYTDGNGNVASWNLRNQWGAGWGESGFVQFEYGTNCCDINGDPTQVNAN